MEFQEEKQTLDKTLEHFKESLAKIRSGRASASILDSIKVEVYGQLTPLKHVATVMAADAQLLTVQPFDPSNLSAISASIRSDQTLGLNPSDDGKIIRLPIPPMTEERRREVVKLVHQKAEEEKISVRNIRHEAMDQLKTQKNEGEISEDDFKRLQKNLESLIEDTNKKVDQIVSDKEKEIMEI